MSVDKHTKARISEAIFGDSSEHFGGDNLAIVLAGHFESNIDCPDCTDDEKDDTGWNPWAIEKVDAVMAEIVGRVLEVLTTAPAPGQEGGE